MVSLKVCRRMGWNCSRKTTEEDREVGCLLFGRSTSKYLGEKKLIKVCNSIAILFPFNLHSFRASIYGSRILNLHSPQEVVIEQFSIYSLSLLSIYLLALYLFVSTLLGYLVSDRWRKAKHGNGGQEFDTGTDP